MYIRSTVRLGTGGYLGLRYIPLAALHQPYCNRGRLQLLVGVNVNVGGAGLMYCSVS